MLSLNHNNQIKLNDRINKQTNYFDQTPEIIMAKNCGHFKMQNFVWNRRSTILVAYNPDSQVAVVAVAVVEHNCPDMFHIAVVLVGNFDSCMDLKQKGKDDIKHQIRNYELTRPERAFSAKFWQFGKKRSLAQAVSSYNETQRPEYPHTFIILQRFLELD